MQFVLDALQQGVEPMSSDDAAAQAVRTAPSVAKAEAASEQARKAASEALVAVYPRLDMTGQYTHLSQPPRIAYPFPNPVTGVLTPVTFPLPLTDQYLLQARVQFPVSDLFLQLMPRYRAAKENVRAQEFTARAQQFTVALQAREAYFNYARARAALVVARFGLAQTQAQLKDTASLVQAGTVARVEQMRAEANVAASQVAVARATGAVAVARTAFRTLLHRAGDQDVALMEDFGAPLPPLVASQDAILQTAFRNRSELRALETVADVQNRNMRAQENGELPKLSIGGNAEVGNPNQRANQSVRQWQGTWAVLGILSWSPNDFARSGAAADQIGAQRAQTLADMAALEDALRTEVSQAYEDYQSAQQAMEAAMTGIRAAEETYRVRREQYRAGAAVATDVVIAENDLNRARLELVNAVIDMHIARARLDRATERNPPTPS
jgi:outer membrane protein TolC